MDFSSAKRLKKKFDNQLHAATSADNAVSTPETVPCSSASSDSMSVHPSTEADEPVLLAKSTSLCPPATVKVPAPTPVEMNDFYVALSQCEHRPALLSLISPFSEGYVTRTLLNIRPLNDLFNKGYISFTIGELQTMAESVDVSITDSDVESVEMMTRGQSTCKDWFTYRAGRITASKLKDACCTDLCKPSVTLLKAVCYPLERSFKTAATEWGVANEKLAITTYRKLLNDHADVVVEECGFFISPDYPFMGASPDSAVSCVCCGRGVVEVKCPYKYRSSPVIDYITSDDSCLALVNDELLLNKKHRYFYQVQAQMHVCDVEFCDFVICTFPCGEPSIFMKRIYRDTNFWDDCVKRASQFFRLCVLPELLGKAYTRPLCNLE